MAKGEDEIRITTESSLSDEESEISEQPTGTKISRKRTFEESTNTSRETSVTAPTDSSVIQTRKRKTKMAKFTERILPKGINYICFGMRLVYPLFSPSQPYPTNVSIQVTNCETYCRLFDKKSLPTIKKCRRCGKHMTSDCRYFGLRVIDEETADIVGFGAIRLNNLLINMTKHYQQASFSLSDVNVVNEIIREMIGAWIFKVIFDELRCLIATDIIKDGDIEALEEAVARHCVNPVYIQRDWSLGLYRLRNDKFYLENGLLAEGKSRHRSIHPILCFQVICDICHRKIFHACWFATCCGHRFCNNCFIILLRVEGVSDEEGDPDLVKKSLLGLRAAYTMVQCSRFDKHSSKDFLRSGMGNLDLDDMLDALRATRRSIDDPNLRRRKYDGN